MNVGTKQGLGSVQPRPPALPAIWRARLCRAALSGLALFLSSCASQFFFYPSKALYGVPSALGQTFENVWFESLDGTKLHGWWVEGEGKIQGTVIHFHGNAQNMSAHYAYVDWLPAVGYNVFVFDYRGYGWSEGKPSRSGAVKDARAALREVLRRTEARGDSVFVLGQSLGGAMALAALAKEQPERVCAVAVDSAFSSYRKLVREKMALMPVVKYIRYPLSWLVIIDRFQPLRAVSKLNGIPLLILHGTADQVVPYHHAEALYDAASDPKLLVTIPGGQHTDAFGGRRAEFADTLLNFFATAGMQDSD